jgi:hypothetical protein
MSRTLRPESVVQKGLEDKLEQAYSKLADLKLNFKKRQDEKKVVLEAKPAIEVKFPA